MHTFCDEVHVLVPFLHLPSLWQLYDDLWTCGLSCRAEDQQIGSLRVQTAHAWNHQVWKGEALSPQDGVYTALPEISLAT